MEKNGGFINMWKLILTIARALLLTVDKFSINNKLCDKFCCFSWERKRNMLIENYYIISFITLTKIPPS